MEDEKWQDNQASERTEGDREGYKPFSSENSNGGENTGRPRIPRPRIQRAQRAYTANGSNGTQEGRSYRPSYNREERTYGGNERPYRSYPPRQDYNRGGYGREGGYEGREGGYNREGGYRQGARAG